MNNIREFLDSLERKMIVKSKFREKTFTFLNDNKQLETKTFQVLEDTPEGIFKLSSLNYGEINFLKDFLNVKDLIDLNIYESSNFQGNSIAINDTNYFYEEFVIPLDKTKSIFDNNAELYVKDITLSLSERGFVFRINGIQEASLFPIETIDLKKLAKKNLNFIEKSDLFELYTLSDEKPKTLVEGDYILKEGYDYEYFEYKDYYQLAEICRNNPEDKIYISIKIKKRPSFANGDSLKAFKITKKINTDGN